MQRQYKFITSAIGLTCGLSLFTYFEANKNTQHQPNTAALKSHYNINQIPTSLTRVLNDYQYTPNQHVAILALLKIYGEKEIKDCHNSSETNVWLKEVTQHRFLRKGERWDAANQEKEQRILKAAPQIEQITQLLGMQESLRPPASVQKHIAIIPGATEGRVKSRINLLKQSIAEGRQPTKIIVATGFRTLQDNEAPEITDPKQRTEAYMAEMLLLKSKINIPYQILATSVKGNIDRSNTVDTAEFIQEDPCFDHADVIVYIEQPFTRRFELIFKTQLQMRDTKIYPFSNPIDSNQPKYWIGDEQARRIYYLFPSLDKQYREEKTHHNIDKRTP